jgi:regulator of nucleoside diphosphate kinase
MPFALQRGERVLTELDFARLSKLESPLLDTVLDEAAIVPSPEVPGEVVTMYSQVVIADPASGERQKFTLCYPEEAEPQNGFISVCSPLGSSLLGRHLGEQVSWPTPSGAKRTVGIESILFQPEATGDYTT